MNPIEEVVRQAAEAMKAGDVEQLSGLLADNLVVHVPPGLSISGDYNSRDEFLGGMFGKVVATLGAPPKLEVHDVVASDDHAVGLYTIRAERDGVSYEWLHVNVYHVREGRVAEIWWNPFDHETVKQALG